MPTNEVIPVESRFRSSVIHHRIDVMGTVVTLDVRADCQKEASDAVIGIERAVASLQRADSVFSTWKFNSPINLLRRGEIAEQDAPPEMAEVLTACAIARHKSRGWFDPWVLPGGVDPTGLVKGWAAQRALDILRICGAASAIVNAAGDIATFGRPETSNPYRIGIVDPARRNELACVVEVAGAIATSGTYERGEHLIDPRLRRPMSRVASASVVGPDLALADALATALAVAGEEGLEFIEATDGYEGFVICRDGEWRWTPLFPFARSPRITPITSL